MATGFSVLDTLNKNSKRGIDTTPKARFRTKDISIHKIYSNVKNFYPQEGIEEKADEILAVGLIDNLAVMYEPSEKGEYKLISGERRWRALKLLAERGYTEYELVTCQVRNPANEHEEKIELIIANSSRNKSVATLLREERELKEELEYLKENGMKIHGRDLSQGRLRDVIASMLHVSKTKIAQMETINKNLIKEFKEEIDKENINFSTAYELSGMSEEQQKEALQRLKDNGELSHKEIKEMKSEKLEEKAVPDYDTEEKPEEAVEKSESRIVNYDQELDQEEPEEYEEPHPVGITSLCYNCKRYLECNVRTSTCTSCDRYINKTEAEKTEEQRYSEEQNRIDRETKRKLQELYDEKKMEILPSERKRKEIEEATDKLCGYVCDKLCSNRKAVELNTKNSMYKEEEMNNYCYECELMNYVQELKDAYEKDYRK